MKALAIDEFNTAPTAHDMPSPAPEEGEVVVEVAASSINAMDVMIWQGMIQGQMPFEFPITLGQDLAGTVLALGPRVTEFQVGDPVFGVHFKMPVHAGALAQQVAIAVTQLARRPHGLTVPAAGALGLAGTAAKMAIDAIAPKPGETVLISGATGGVGSLALQLAKRTGARVLATATDDQAPFVLGLGADDVVGYTIDLGAEVRRSGTDGVECVVHLAGDAMALAAVCLPGARFASTLGWALGALAGRQLEIASIMATPKTETLNALAVAVAAGELTVPISRTYTLDQVPDALADFAAGTTGKLGVTVA